MATFCRDCGSEIHENAEICPKCGCRQKNLTSTNYHHIEGSSKHGRLCAALLCYFLGCIGVHRFYVGKIGTGIAMIFTFGGFGIWAMIDLIMICCGNFRDSENKLLIDWMNS